MQWADGRECAPSLGHKCLDFGQTVGWRPLTGWCYSLGCPEFTTKYEEYTFINWIAHTREVVEFITALVAQASGGKPYTGARVIQTHGSFVLRSAAICEYH